MGNRPFPETSCALCSKPVDLQSDLSADENGSAVHEDCYVNRIIGTLPFILDGISSTNVRGSQLIGQYLRMTERER